VKVLLDTHTFLWWVADDPQISVTAKNIIANPDDDIDKGGMLMRSPFPKIHLLI
jgi:hypothetical protein